MADLPEDETDGGMFGPLDSGIYGIVDEKYRVRFVGRSQQLRRRVVLLQHRPWKRDDLYGPVPLIVEPFPDPAPRRLVEQAAVEHYREKLAKSAAPARQRRWPFSRG